jgi:hypothetical protein
MSETPTDTTTEDFAGRAGDELEQPPAPTPVSTTKDYWIARVVTLVSATVAAVGGKASFGLIEWMNRIDNARPQAEHYGPIFERVMLALGVLLCFLCVLASCGSYPPLRLAGKVSISVIIASLTILFVPYLGMIVPEILLYVPVGFFGSVVVRATIDSWFRLAPARSLLIAGPIATVTGLTSLFLSVCIGKLFALAWARM